MVDLGECSGNDNECTNSVSFNVRAFDEDCGRLISEVFTVTRDDTIVPTIVSGPADMTVEVTTFLRWPDQRLWLRRTTR